VFFNYLIDEEYLEDKSNPMRRIKSLNEEKRVVFTFNDEQVKRIINDFEGRNVF